MAKMIFNLEFAIRSSTPLITGKPIFCHLCVLPVFTKGENIPVYLGNWTWTWDSLSFQLARQMIFNDLFCCNYSCFSNLNPECTGGYRKTERNNSRRQRHAC